MEPLTKKTKTGCDISSLADHLLGEGVLPPAAAGGVTVNVSSHKCLACDIENKLSVYCVACGHCGATCAECGLDGKVGALDTGDNRWYCKACWIKNTPEGVKGPFAADFEAAKPSAEGDKKAKNDELETLAAPSTNDVAKKAHWAQVFATFQQVGMSQQALEYAQVLRKLRGTIQELFTKYKEALASEENLLKSAYNEALQAYKEQQAIQDQQAQEMEALGSESAIMLDAAYKEAIDLQVQAHAEVEAHAAELQSAVQQAHDKAAAALADSGKTVNGIPKRNCLEDLARHLASSI